MHRARIGMMAGLKGPRQPKKLLQVRLRRRAPAPPLASNLAPQHDFLEQAGSDNKNFGRSANISSGLDKSSGGRN